MLNSELTELLEILLIDALVNICTKLDLKIDGINLQGTITVKPSEDNDFYHIPVNLNNIC